MRRAAPLLMAGAALGLVVVGVAVFAVADRRPVEPFAAYSGSYEPLPETFPADSSLVVTAAEDAVLWTGGHVLGAGLVVMALLVMAAIGGWSLGRRRQSSRTPSPYMSMSGQPLNSRGSGTSTRAGFPSACCAWTRT
jgi:hypothetical protein